MIKNSLRSIFPDFWVASYVVVLETLLLIFSPLLCWHNLFLLDVLSVSLISSCLIFRRANRILSLSTWLNEPNRFFHSQLSARRSSSIWILLKKKSLISINSTFTILEKRNLKGTNYTGHSSIVALRSLKYERKLLIMFKYNSVELLHEFPSVDEILQ